MSRSLLTVVALVASLLLIGVVVLLVPERPVVQELTSLRDIERIRAGTTKLAVRGLRIDDSLCHADMSKLHRLYLFDCELDRASLEFFKTLGALRVLVLRRCTFTDDSWVQEALLLLQVEEIYAVDCIGISDSAFLAMIEVDSIQVVDIAGSGISDKYFSRSESP